MIKLKKMDGHFKLATPYKADFVDALKGSCRGRIWDAEEKVWIFPATEKNAAALRTLLRRYWDLSAETCDRLIYGQIDDVDDVQIRQSQKENQSKDFAAHLPIGKDEIVARLEKVGISLYDHQIEALVRAESGARLYQMEMGTGKTRMSIAHFMIHRDRYDVMVVIGPKKALEETWTKELALVAKDLKVALLKGGKIVGDYKTADLIMINVDIFSRSNSNLDDILDACMSRKGFVTIDESTTIKNPKAQRTKKITAFTKRCVSAFALTGTIITRSPEDVYAQVKAVDTLWDRYKDVYAWMRTYLVMEPNRWGGFDVKGIKDTAKLNRELDSIRYSKLRHECLQLPEYQDHWIDAELTKEQKKALKDLETTMKTYGQTVDGKEVKMTVAHRIAIWQKARQIVGGCVYTQKGDVIEMPSGKVDALKDILIGAGERVVLFVEFRHELARLARVIKEDMSRDVFTIEEIDAWRQSVDGVLIMTTSSGGMSLNLQSASVMIFFSLGTSAALYQQARSRIYRHGQTKKCIYYHLMSGAVDMRLKEIMKGKIIWQEALMGVEKILKED